VPAPILLGVLFDFPQQDGGTLFCGALQLGMGDGAMAVAGRPLDRDVEFAVQETAGLPAGSAHAVETGFRELVDAGVLAIAGPSISDNGLIARDLADAAQVPAINYTGGQRTRSRFMFHYQVGSLEEEPLLLAQHLASRGVQRVAAIFDRSPVGRQYVEWLEIGCSLAELDLVATVAISPLATEAAEPVGRCQAADPDALVYLGLGVASHPVALAVRAAAWDVTVVANSSLMFGYARPDWREAFEGWVYVDTVADDNQRRAMLRERSARAAGGPIGVAAYDIGRLFGAALARTDHLTRAGVAEALEGVKRLPATSGHDATMMGFGVWDHAALKGPFLVLRQWLGGKSVQY